MFPIEESQQYNDTMQNETRHIETYFFFFETYIKKNIL